MRRAQGYPLRWREGFQKSCEWQERTPQPAAASAGSISSALVLASFMGGSRGGAETRRVGENDGKAYLGI